MSPDINHPDSGMLAMDDDGADAVQVAATPRRGRPRGPARQTQVRESNRDPGRGLEVVGRDGEILTRHRQSASDPFEIPPDVVPDGWTYQWNVVSVTGNAEVVLDQSNGMYENGWRPVPADRHPGRFVPRGTKGEVIRGGQRLEERPLVLTQQARAEDMAYARRQVSDRDQALMGNKANLRGAMGNGIEMGGRYRGTGGDLRMSIDRGLDIPTPQHELAGPED